MPEIHALGVFAHGALVALHALGIMFNLRRNNKTEAAMHTVAVGCSIYAVYTHVKEAQKDTNDAC